jgi:hypothetical protein
MNSTPRIAALTATAAVAAGVATGAQGASWKGPTYPAKAISSNLALAVAPNGRATVLFQGPKRSIAAISRTGPTARWSKTAQPWLAAEQAGVKGPLAAAFAGSRLAVVWSGTTGTLRSVAGSQGRATSRVRSAKVRPPVGAIGLQGGSASTLQYGLWSPAGQAVGAMTPGALPAALPSAANSPPAGTNVLHQAVDGAGNWTALVLMAPTQLGVMTRPAGGAWGAPVALPTPLKTAVGAPLLPAVAAGTATDLAVDAGGDAAIAFVTGANPTTGALDPAGTGFTLAVVQRQGATGAFGAAQAVGNTQPPYFGGFGAAPPVGVAISPAAVVAAWGTGLGSPDVGGGVGILSSIAAPGQPFPPATLTVIGSTENWNPDGLQAAVTPSGMGAVMMWGDGAQGDAQDLGVTTSLGPGQPWSKEFSLAGRKTGEQGYPGATIMPFNTGFVAAWSAGVQAEAGDNATYYVGVASFM